jgi:hypothetical protein
MLQDASVVLDAWQRLLLDPSTTLAAGSCLRGHLLRLVSVLVEDVAAGKATAAGADGTAVLTAVLRLLELNPNISRWGQYFQVQASCCGVVSAAATASLLLLIQHGLKLLWLSLLSLWTVQAVTAVATVT